MFARADRCRCLWLTFAVLLVCACTPVVKDATPIFPDPSPDGIYDIRLVVERSSTWDEGIKQVIVTYDDRSTGTPQEAPLREISPGVWEAKVRLNDCERRVYYALIASTGHSEFRIPKEGYSRIEVRRYDRLEIHSIQKAAVGSSIVFIRDPNKPAAIQSAEITAKNSLLHSVRVINVAIMPEDVHDFSRMSDHQVFSLPFVNTKMLPQVLACGDTFPVTLNFNAALVSKKVRARLLFDLEEPWPDVYVPLIGLPSPG